MQEWDIKYTRLWVVGFAFFSGWLWFIFQRWAVVATEVLDLVPVV
jgi:hypothetical protein